ncbi:hypothetical protein A3D03_01025 [Candidatus Gottesmanbacteria bacterium RIFCSPHIGHO2_02_FULL_40_13]|uniref:PIN domain-containing protein n=1 Tax=Candidatus Gottesmanbacteria bacterium RIFCSPHIGHO2_02_FULL_40_13 TaxID=1798384 RepID=A0A1F6A5C7_9BACT|nr:MAG: hypothetical protein A3D03_01025 [Candidatus Gottesmanbacteria bacterium RIFCSPHIGHO2_02_FULL_40_13]
MEEILLDTDVFIDYLRGHKERVKDVFLRVENGQIKGIVSQLTLVELYAGDIEGREKEREIVKLLSYFEIIRLNDTLCKLAGKVRWKYKLGIADAVIAATCIETSTKLLTFNLKHFTNLPGIMLYSL